MNLNQILKNLQPYYKGIDGVEETILNCALVAGGATAVGSVFPVLALPSMIVSCVGAVWAMYIRICKQMEIPLRENLLRFLASAALSNIATNLVAAFAAELLAMVFPGVGSFAGAAVTFGCIYLAGVMFLEMILSFAKKGTVGAALSNLSKSELKDEIKEQTPSREDVREVRTIFEENRSKEAAE